MLQRKKSGEYISDVRIPAGKMTSVGLSETQALGQESEPRARVVTIMYVCLFSVHLYQSSHQPRASTIYGANKNKRGRFRRTDLSQIIIVANLVQSRKFKQFKKRFKHIYIYQSPGLLAAFKKIVTVLEIIKA